MTVAQLAHTIAYGRAAQELCLRRSEFDLAVHLGHVRTVPSPSGGRPRVPREEIDRLRAEPDFPAGLRDRVSTVGTAQAAELAGISPDRFTRLARTGHFSPVAYYLNRYRAVVWLYLAREVVDAARRHPDLLTGQAPAALRERLKAGEDARPRTWRARHRRLLTGQACDAWGRAAVLASFLDPNEVAGVVPDGDERDRLERLRPAPPHGHPESPAARAVADRLLIADDPDEVASLRADLAKAVRAARRSCPTPRLDTANATGPTAPATPASSPPRAYVATVTPEPPPASPGAAGRATSVAASVATGPAGPPVGHRFRRRPAPTAPASSPLAAPPGPVAPPGPDGRRRKAARTGFLTRLGLRRPRVG